MDEKKSRKRKLQKSSSSSRIKDISNDSESTKMEEPEDYFIKTEFLEPSDETPVNVKLEVDCEETVLEKYYPSCSNLNSVQKPVTVEVIIKDEIESEKIEDMNTDSATDTEDEIKLEENEEMSTDNETELSKGDNEGRFYQADCNNLPEVDIFMIMEFMIENKTSGAMDALKIPKPERSGYGDDAIGFVELKREGDVCTIKGKVTPEHCPNIAYNCNVEFNEKAEKIWRVSCVECGIDKICKHSVALLLWLHRRNEEREKPQYENYYKESVFSVLSNGPKFITLKELAPHPEDHEEVDVDTTGFFEKVIDFIKEKRIDCPLMRYVTEETDVEKMSLHHMVCTFPRKSKYIDVEKFIIYCKAQMKESILVKVQEATASDENSELWAEMYYGRITDSKMDEVAHCKRKDSSIITEEVLGLFTETDAMERAKKLNDDVIKHISQIKNLKISKSGIILHNEWPMFAASPDGIAKDHVIEIKYITKTTDYEKYFIKGSISKNYYAQLQSQMHISGKREALLCIVHGDFETSKNVNMYRYIYDKQYCDGLFEKCEKFWKKYIAKKLTEIATS